MTTNQYREKIMGASMPGASSVQYPLFFAEDPAITIAMKLFILTIRSGGKYDLA